MTAELAASLTRNHNAGEVSVSKAYLDAVAGLCRIRELGGHRVVEEFVDGHRKGYAGDVVRIDREEGLGHG